jgi:hypothetical protein
METNRRRKIRSGKEFDHLFPPPTQEDQTIKAAASVEDTMALIQKTVPQTLWHTKKIAAVLKGRSLEETCSNIWHFVYRHIQYKRDKEGIEQIRSPRRTWSERQTGVDCDCYTEFISSILYNLGIPHVARITKYPKRYPEVPRWQHVYPIVPKVGREHTGLEDRDDYIVIDCVKEDFDDEQPYLECKDYTMRLDYLDGIEYEQAPDENIDYVEHDNVDLADIASMYEDDEEVGSLLKKVSSAVKKATTNVASTVKTTATKAASTVKSAAANTASNVKAASKTVAAHVKTTAQKAGDKIGDGIRVINRYVNPATILLRNGFLLAMKINLMNVAGRLRYAYLTDAQAQAKGISISELNKVRSIKDRAETVYWQAGGKKENLKKAILQGKGNKDKKVPLNGLSGMDGLDNVYADMDEYNIIHSNNIEGLGEIASATAITAATAAVAAIAGALKQVTGLFVQGGNEEQAFQSETDNAGTAATAPSSIPDDEDAFTYEDTSYSEPESVPFTVPTATVAPKIAAPVQSAISKIVSAFAPSSQSEQSNTPTPDSFSNEQQIDPTTASSPESALPDQLTTPGSKSLATQSTAANLATKNQSTSSPKEGFLKKTTTWVKKNPGKTLLVAGGIVAGGIFLAKALSSPAKNNTSGLSGLSKSKSKGKSSRKKKRKLKKHPVKKQILL